MINLRRLQPLPVLNALLAPIWISALASSALWAQERQEKELDLADSTTEIPVAADEILTFQVTNRIPGREYQVRVRRVVEKEPALPRADVGTEATADCPTIARRMLEQLKRLQSEQEVAGELAKALGPDTECKREVETLVVPKTTISVPGRFVTETGVTLVVIVERIEEDGSGVDKTWEFRFVTGLSGEWDFVYGFSFVPKAVDDLVFLRTEADTMLADGGQEIAQRFVVAELDKEREFDFLPSIMYRWIPWNAASEPFTFGFTGGIGADLQRVSALLGLTINYRSNLSLYGGVAVLERNRRDPRYQLGQILTEQLKEDALHEEYFGATYYVGMGLRLGKSPFAQQKEDRPTPPDGGGGGT